MKKLLQSNKTILTAVEKEYTVNNEGCVYFKTKKRNTFITKHGYLSFTIRVKINGKNALGSVLVHRLQAYQKYKEEIFKKNIDVRHFDGNRLNNSIENILIGTRSQNSLDKPVLIRMRAALIATSFVRKHNHEEILKLHQQGFSYSNIMKKLNIKSKGAVSYVINKSMAAKKTY